MTRVLVIGDLHCPATHPRYIDFIRDMQDAWQTDRVVFIGDVVDLHAISYHAHELDADNVFAEHSAAKQYIAEWYEEFPKADVTVGNHDERVARKAKDVGIPEIMLKPYAELWGTPRWNWCDYTEIDGVHYTHGTGMSGERPAFTRAKQAMQSSVMGHTHSKAGVSWLAGPHQTVFGMNVGCGVDPDHPAMRYSKSHLKRPMLGCGMVIDGTPFFEPMDMGGKYRKKGGR